MALGLLALTATLITPQLPVRRDIGRKTSPQDDDDGTQLEQMLNVLRSKEKLNAVLMSALSRGESRSVALELANEMRAPPTPLPLGGWSASRRRLVAAAMAGLGAETAWRQAVVAAATAIETVPATSILPPGTIEQLDAGRAVVLNNWLPPEETAALRADQIACLEAKLFKDFTSNIHSGTILSMPSFYGRGKDGPFGDPAIGEWSVRQRFMARMAVVKAALADQMQDRPSLADDIRQTHEIQYLHYYPGAQVSRHTDERHVELKRPNGSRLPKKPDATRRSITWYATHARQMPAHHQHRYVTIALHAAVARYVLRIEHDVIGHSALAGLCT